MCWKCGNNIEENEIFRSSACPACGADLHSCRNCRFYAPGSHYDCAESIFEPVRDKERGNFCDFYAVRRDWGGAGAPGAHATREADKARDAFAALFS